MAHCILVAKRPRAECSMETVPHTCQCLWAHPPAATFTHAWTLGTHAQSTGNTKMVMGHTIAGGGVIHS